METRKGVLGPVPVFCKHRIISPSFWSRCEVVIVSVLHREWDHLDHFSTYVDYPWWHMLESSRLLLKFTCDSGDCSCFRLKKKICSRDYSECGLECIILCFLHLYIQELQKRRFECGSDFSGESSSSARVYFFHLPRHIVCVRAVGFALGSRGPRTWLSSTAPPAALDSELDPRWHSRI